MPKPLTVDYLGYSCSINVQKDDVLGLVSIPVSHYLSGLSSGALTDILGVKTKALLVDGAYFIGEVFKRGTSFDDILSDLYDKIEAIKFKVPEVRYRPYTKAEGIKNLKLGGIVSHRYTSASEFMITGRVVSLETEDILVQVGYESFTLADMFSYFHFPNLERCGAKIE